MVVNHLRFKAPAEDSTVQAFEAVVRPAVEAGAIAAQVVRVDDTHFILVLTFASAADADRMAREVGGPWMREHITPLLAGGTDRSLGEIIASAP